MKFIERIHKNYSITAREEVDEFKNFKIGDVVKILKGPQAGKYGLVRHLPSASDIQVETVDRRSTLNYGKNDIEKVITQ